MEKLKQYVIISFIMMMFSLFLISLSYAPDVFAEQQSFTVNGETIQFDTGDGSDGDVKLYSFGMYVNGNKVAKPSTTETILNNNFESYHQDLSYDVYLLEDIVQYLPSNKNYSPSTTRPGSGNIPNFNNLYIGSGVMLKSNSTAVNFKVKDTLTVKGLIMTEHGEGGKVVNNGHDDGGDGENGTGPVFIMANNINVAPNGSNASSGAIMSGWGGGGAASWDEGGNGGKAYDLKIFCNKLNNNGEIRAGNGGGAGSFPSDHLDYGYESNPGEGGDLKIYSNTINNNGVLASGYGGGKTAYFDEDRDDCFSGWTYGGGGRVEFHWHHDSFIEYTYTLYDGGTGGSRCSGYGQDATVGRSDAGNGAWDNGLLIIKTDTLNNNAGKLINGYSSGGDAYHSYHHDGTRGGETLRIYTNHADVGTIIQQEREELSLYAKKDAFFDKDSHTFNNLEADKLNITGATNININSGITNSLTTTSSTKIAGSITINSSAKIKGDLGNLNIQNSGPTRFASNSNYKNDNWWTNRTVKVNGFEVRGVMPSATPNDMGINEVDLHDWIDKYNNPSGTQPTMKFIVERNVEGESEWTASNPFERNLSGEVTWQDMDTVAEKEITYRVGFKDPSSSLGYIYLETNNTSSTSEGGIGVDTTYEGESASYWAYMGARMSVFYVINGQEFAEAIYSEVEGNDKEGNNVQAISKEGFSVITGTLTITDTNNDGVPDKSYEFKKVVIDDKTFIFKVIASPTSSTVSTVKFK